MSHEVEAYKFLHMMAEVKNKKKHQSIFIKMTKFMKFIEREKHEILQVLTHDVWGDKPKINLSSRQIHKVLAENRLH